MSMLLVYIVFAAIIAGFLRLSYMQPKINKIVHKLQSELTSGKLEENVGLICSKDGDYYLLNINKSENMFNISNIGITTMLMRATQSPETQSWSIDEVSEIDHFIHSSGLIGLKFRVNGEQYEFKVISSVATPEQTSKSTAKMNRSIVTMIATLLIGLVTKRGMKASTASRRISRNSASSGYSRVVPVSVLELEYLLGKTSVAKEFQSELQEYSRDRYKHDIKSAFFAWSMILLYFVLLFVIFFVIYDSNL